MSKDRSSSTPEKEILNFILCFFPNSRKLRIRKIAIENRPYIYGFDIDIFIPEFNKGIEFDGTYWHSVERLRKSKKTWPLEDIQNYHQIKDDYFRSKGIEILHIKEEDWIKDKDRCLDLCLKFLSFNL